MQPSDGGGRLVVRVVASSKFAPWDPPGVRARARSPARTVGPADPDPDFTPESDPSTEATRFPRTPSVLCYAFLEGPETRDSDAQASTSGRFQRVGHPRADTAWPSPTTFCRSIASCTQMNRELVTAIAKYQPAGSAWEPSWERMLQVRNGFRFRAFSAPCPINM